MEVLFWVGVIIATLWAISDWQKNKDELNKPLSVKNPNIDDRPDIRISVSGNEDESILLLTLKAATAFKKNGEIDNAVTAMKAVHNMREDCPEYMVEYDIKYANYLQLSGQNDEGWGVLNNAREYFIKDMYSHSKISNAMRLFLQREGKNGIAVSFGINTIMWKIRTSLINLSNSTSQEHIEIFNQQIMNESSAESLNKNIMRLLKKANHEDKYEEIISIVKPAIDILPTYNEADFKRKIDRVVIASTQLEE